ncbi:unnamed protein product [Thlaspi arvense]|uniref:Dirigent protein n=1 Tax=Thlaspi arvense TaxID=13288 RepID=A0AAU9SBB9_THLAR|nr:unnamed protein product [Thlaspi arvense]
MAKAEDVIRMLVVLITVMPLVAQGSSRLYSWANRLEESGKEKVTNLQFYFHDTLSGKNPTAVKVAQAADTEKSPTLFGATFMVDDALTETADPKSKLVGRAQGLYGSSCTGLFRMARGYAIAQTNWFDPKTGDAVVGYNVTVYH